MKVEPEDIKGSEDIKDFNELCMHLGFVVMNWALIEQALDKCIEIIYTKCGGPSLEPEMPRQLKRKIKFARQAFNTFVALQPFAQEGKLILDRMVTFSKTRHDLVHGVVTNVKLKTGVFVIRKLDHTAKGPAFRDIPFDPKAFQKLELEALDLGEKIALFGQNLAIRFP